MGIDGGGSQVRPVWRRMGCCVVLLIGGKIRPGAPGRDDGQLDLRPIRGAISELLKVIDGGAVASAPSKGEKTQSAAAAKRKAMQLKTDKAQASMLPTSSLFKKKS